MQFSFMLEYSSRQVAGHADIERVAAAGNDIRVVVLFVHRTALLGI